MEARDIMWSRTRQGQVAKQPCPVGSIGESRGGRTWRAVSICLWDIVSVQPGCPQTPVAHVLPSAEHAHAFRQVCVALVRHGKQLAGAKASVRRARCAGSLASQALAKGEYKLMTLWG